MRKRLILILMVLFSATADVLAQSVQECRQMLSEYFELRSRELPYDIDDFVAVENLKYENTTVRVGLSVNDEKQSVETMVRQLFSKFREHFAPHEATDEIKDFLNTMIKAGTEIEFLFEGRNTNNKVKHVVTLNRLKEIYSQTR